MVKVDFIFSSFFNYTSETKAFEVKPSSLKIWNDSFENLTCKKVDAGFNDSLFLHGNSQLKNIWGKNSNVQHREKSKQEVESATYSFPLCQKHHENASEEMKLFWTGWYWR